MNDYDLNQRVLYAREAAEVKRCHNFPWQGSYTVGQHSFNMLTLAHHLMPKASLTRGLIMAITFHDLAERMVGDMPAPFKWAMPEVDEALHQTEADVLRAANMEMPQLFPFERKWLKALDRIELWLACHDQVALGNTNAQVMIKAINQWFIDHASDIPQEALAFIANYRHERLADGLPRQTA